MADPDAYVELRCQVPRLVINVMDAVSTSQRMPRSDLLNVILAEWADDRMREATAVLRMTTGPGDR